MATFNSSARTLTLEPIVHAETVARTLAALREAEEAAAPGGPGWFDSSFDLHRGLEVREGLPGDASLNEWLTVCLQG